jgi:ribonuclease HII
MGIMVHAGRDVKEFKTNNEAKLDDSKELHLLVEKYFFNGIMYPEILIFQDGKIAYDYICIDWNRQKNRKIKELIKKYGLNKINKNYYKNS